jgi:hypothetical protein
VVTTCRLAPSHPTDQDHSAPPPRAASRAALALFTRP